MQEHPSHAHITPAPAGEERHVPPPPLDRPPTTEGGPRGGTRARAVEEPAAPGAATHDTDPSPPTAPRLAAGDGRAPSVDELQRLAVSLSMLAFALETFDNLLHGSGSEIQSLIRRDPQGLNAARHLPGFEGVPRGRADPGGGGASRSCPFPWSCLPLRISRTSYAGARPVAPTDPAATSGPAPNHARC
jgi:hypothetical protein